jgi:hypothetical protein
MIVQLLELARAAKDEAELAHDRDHELAQWERIQELTALISPLE